MLKITNSTSTEGYTSTDMPIVHVTHHIEYEPAVKIAKMMFAKYGDQFLQDCNIVSKHAVKQEPYEKVLKKQEQFFVCVEGGRAPTVPHDTYASAAKEALRLLEKTGCNTAIFKRVGLAKSVTESTVVNKVVNKVEKD